MDNEQFENKNCAGLDTISERLSQSRQKKSLGLLKDMGMIPRQTKKVS
jgi:hypothetical protein